MDRLTADLLEIAVLRARLDDAMRHHRAALQEREAAERASTDAMYNCEFRELWRLRPFFERRRVACAVVCRAQRRLRAARYAYDCAVARGMPTQTDMFA